MCVAIYAFRCRPQTGVKLVLLDENNKRYRGVAVLRGAKFLNRHLVGVCFRCWVGFRLGRDEKAASNYSASYERRSGFSGATSYLFIKRDGLDGVSDCQNILAKNKIRT